MTKENSFSQGDKVRIVELHAMDPNNKFRPEVVGKEAVVYQAGNYYDGSGFVTATLHVKMQDGNYTPILFAAVKLEVIEYWDRPNEPLTVGALLEYLKTLDPKMGIVFSQYSDYTQMQRSDVRVSKMQMPRGDGYVGSARDDKPSIDWLVFPGN